MDVSGLEAKADEWREEAHLLRRRGQKALAHMAESYAEEIEVAIRRWVQEELTVADATKESGYSAERLRELVREGKIPDLRPEGSRGEIRIRRCDLPRKPAVGRETVSAVDRLHEKLSHSRR